MGTPTRLALLTALAIGLPGLVLTTGCSAPATPPARPTDKVAFGTTGPYVILSSTKAATAYAAAIAEARTLHNQAAFRSFDPADLASLLGELRKTPPRYALVFLLPDELDVNFAWRWMTMTTQLDDDPFVDLRTGFITGESPDAALAFVKRIGQFARGEISLPRRLVDNLGPNTEAPKGSCFVQETSFMIPVYADGGTVTTISHGLEGFTAEKMKHMEGAGFVHYGGHGYPDRVVDSLNGPWVRKIRFAPSVFFNGACYTGVTSGWFDVMGPTLTRKAVKPGESFCLGVLASGPVAYLAALHPDHGIPVYQEMEYLAFTGAPLGDVIKYTHDGVVLGGGGQVPAFVELKDGMPNPFRTPAEFMLNGTATRVLYGDPAMKPIQPFTDPPFDVTCTAAGTSLQVTATIRNLKLKSTFTETYFSELSQTNQFNDRALLTCELPKSWTTVSEIAKLSATAGGQHLTAKLIGFGVEQDGRANLLHVLIDLPSTGYQEGPFRKAGAKVTFTAERETPKGDKGEKGDKGMACEWVRYEGQDGPGKGKRIVLVSGDEEYRSEEGLPQLGKILATHHGFACTVLFAIDPTTGAIAPNCSNNIPGLEALKTADLMIIATRFRNLPDEQMKHIVDYLESGKPVIGLRTATHAFKIPSDRTYAKYSFDSKTWDAGFGRQVLGETWIDHHGHHGKESTRGVIAPDARNHPIVKGCEDIWGPSDVYRVRLPLTGNGKALILGQVLEGMNPTDKPVTGPKNEPMMPVAWTRTYHTAGGKDARVFTTTMGAATDLQSEGLRRLIVNAAYWCVGLEDRIPDRAKVDIIGEYQPLPFGFGTFKKGVKPAEHAQK